MTAEAETEVEEADPTDGEHMYEDVYNMNHMQAKADKQSDGIHTYYNETYKQHCDRTATQYEALTYI